MPIITDVKKLLAAAQREDPEKVELRERVRVLTNRVSLLEIQGGRLKEERDEARGHLQRIRSSIAIMT